MQKKLFSNFAEIFLCFKKITDKHLFERNMFAFNNFKPFPTGWDHPVIVIRMTCNISWI